MTAVADTDLLVGDLNMPPGPATRLTGLHPLAIALTFPVDRPSVQIDHLLARGDGPVGSAARALPLPVSDHRALVVDLSR